MKRLFVVFLTAVAMTACEHVAEKPDYNTGKPSASASANNSRYSVDQDFSPDVLLDPAKIQDAIPREEYVTTAGNKSPYTVLGKTYEVLSSPRGYRGRGGASWYGLKFHGHKTSNGETYDIYEMTAAHKTLPIPCYVKVTNLENGKTAIVRVNDRGPFHDGRIIDLSYAAATKLGMINKGTAHVEVEAIDVRQWQANSTYAAIVPVSMDSEIIETSGGAEPSAPVYSQPEASSTLQAGYIYLQVGAYLEQATASTVHKKLYNSYANVSIESGRDRFHRVRIGPVSETEGDRITADLLRQGYPQPMRIR